MVKKKSSPPLPPPQLLLPHAPHPHTYINYGSYGCVIRPPVTGKQYILKDYIAYSNPKKNDIGKIFKGNHSIFNEELALLKKVKKLDPKGIFTVQLKGAQKISASSLTSNKKTTQCLKGKEPHKELKKYYYQIILENGGKEINADYSLKFPVLLKKLHQFVGGLVTMQAHGLVHCDIKPSNVLISKGKINLIDFGLALPVGEVYSSVNRSRLAHKYDYYPPEFFIAYILMKYGSVSGDTEKNRYVLNNIFDYLNKENYFNQRIYDDHVLLNSCKESIREFTQQIISRNTLNFNDIFTKDIALKADVYPMYYIIRGLRRRAVAAVAANTDNKEDMDFLRRLEQRCYAGNPNDRIRMKDLFDILDERIR